MLYNNPREPKLLGSMEQLRPDLEQKWIYFLTVSDDLDQKNDGQMFILLNLGVIYCWPWNHFLLLALV